MREPADADEPVEDRDVRAVDDELPAAAEPVDDAVLLDGSERGSAEDDADESVVPVADLRERRREGRERTHAADRHVDQDADLVDDAARERAHVPLVRVRRSRRVPRREPDAAGSLHGSGRVVRR